MPKKKGKGSGKSSGKGKKGGKKGKDGAPAPDQPVPDPLSHEARTNAYYISHGPVEFLTFRGYTWSGGGGKKKK